MICDLCKESSNRVIRVDSWQVCQWCVSNNVLEHALEVEVNIAKLTEAVAKTSATHQCDIRDEAMAGTKLELAYAAYADLTTAMNDLAASTAAAKGSLQLTLAAKKSLEDYKRKENRHTRKARLHT